MRTRPPASPWPPATISEAGGVRYLHLGTPWVQGAMRIREPLAIELEYVQRMMVWLLLRPGADLAKGHAVQLGLGAGAITRFCHSKLRMRTTAVEINPSVIGAGRAWFHLPQDSARLIVIEQDAGKFVAEPQRAATVQVLCVDLYDHEAAAPVLDSEGFYADCRAVLSDDGVMSVNLFGRQTSFTRSVQRIAAAFGASQVRSMQPTREGNSIVVAVKSQAFPTQSLLAARAQNIETRLRLPARKWLRMIRPLAPTPLESTEHTELARE
ncbi:MAG: spermidine synthase [Burkholderiaceae bacterium]